MKNSTTSGNRFGKILISIAFWLLLWQVLSLSVGQKLLLCSPFALVGSATKANWDKFSEVRLYIDIVERLAKELDCYYLPLQPVFDEAAAKYGNDLLLRDGVHPTVQGSVLIAREWMKKFEEIEKEMSK